MSSNRNRKKWFKPLRGSYIPNSTFGWLCYLPFIGYLLISARIVTEQPITRSYKVISIAGQWVTATLVMSLIAKRLS